MKKWIPIYGTFTKEADNITNPDINFLMVVYHGFIAAGVVLLTLFKIFI